MSKNELENTESCDDGESLEGLMPHRQTLFGLKVVDAEEAATVQKVGGSVLGLMALLCLHFLIHVHHQGDVLHAVGHLIIVLVLPAAGYVAVSQRSKRAAWAFHILVVVSSAFHARALAAIVPHMLRLEMSGDPPDCSDFAAPCTGAAAELATNSFSPDHSIWRCHGGLCIKGSNYCDHKVNCYDSSDEKECSPYNPAEAVGLGESWALDNSRSRKTRMEKCLKFNLKRDKAPVLKYWWILMSLPMWALCFFAAYHSLEFYVQLRVRQFAARVDESDAGQATIFERDDDKLRGGL